MKHLYRSVFSAGALRLLVAAPALCGAQPIQPPTQAEAQAALNPAPTFTQPQLDQMLAPIALYPDQLLTQLLMAATFPDQVVDAGKWLQDGSNAGLKGDDLVAALQPLPWDPSVKSLVAFPQIIAMMINHLDWTQALGAAFANQEVQVFARVQFLRQRAQRAGMLKSTSQIAVSEQDTDIVIAPTDPNMVYVPVYNPADVYGAWPDNDYPPVFIPPPPGFYSGGAIGAGIAFSVGFGVVAPLWGWGHPDWRNHSVIIDSTRYQHITSQTYIRDNHITIQNQRLAPQRAGGDRRRCARGFGDDGRARPQPARSTEAPDGDQAAVRPSEAFHPGVGGPRPAGTAQPGPRPGRPRRPTPPRPHPPGLRPRRRCIRARPRRTRAPRRRTPARCRTRCRRAPRGPERQPPPPTGETPPPHTGEVPHPPGPPQQPPRIPERHLRRIRLKCRTRCPPCRPPPHGRETPPPHPGEVPHPPPTVQTPPNGSAAAAATRIRPRCRTRRAPRNLRPRRSRIRRPHRRRIPRRRRIRRPGAEAPAKPGRSARTSSSRARRAGAASRYPPRPEEHAAPPHPAAHPAAKQGHGSSRSLRLEHRMP